jgi:hypothetical protein
VASPQEAASRSLTCRAARTRSTAYIGTEPQQEWTAAELETRYRQYKKEIGKGSVRKGPS